jgi:hypothetical protein
MPERCETCFLHALDVSEPTVCRVFAMLEAHQQLIPALTSPVFAVLDTPEAKNTPDPAVQRAIVSRGIACCFAARNVTGDCHESPLIP